jgi:PAS domain S-box-containing protein
VLIDLKTPGEDLFDALVECAQCLVCVFDRAGRIVRFNSMCERATGFAAADVLGLDARESIIPPEEVNAFTSFLEDIWSSPRPSPQVGHWVGSDGRRVPIAWTNHPVLDEDGNVAYLVTSGIDVTEEGAHDQALREQLSGVVVLAQEQAALRRVATLAAGATSPEPIFQAVSAECAGFLGAAASGVFRYPGDGTATVVGRFSPPGSQIAFPVGSSIDLAVDSAAARVFHTGDTVSITYDGVAGDVAEQMRSFGFAASVAAPIHVHQQLWGSVVVVMREDTPASPALLQGSQEQLGAFAELIALAVADTDAREHLLASRARIVRAADDARRKLERNLHDGAQQRLVALAIRLRLARRQFREGDLSSAGSHVDSACDEIEHAIEDLRQLANGLHPPLLSEGGVGPALAAVGKRLPLSIEIDVQPGRFDADLEAAVYYVAAEALTNAVKHAQATTAAVEIVRDGEWLRLTVCDDGRGGANEGSGTGLRGLRDRVEALRGRFEVRDGGAGGTEVVASLPLSPTVDD